MIKNQKEYIDAIETLNSWAYAYYVEDNPLVTDEVYDRLYHQILDYEGKNPAKISPDSPTQRVGDVIKSGFRKSKHLSRMWSMEDIFTYEELSSWLDKISKSYNGEFYIEPKFDGASLNLIYEDGELQRAITRGDGEVGEDVTENAKTIESIPKIIDYSGLIEIRGEVLMKFSEFERINAKRVSEGLNPFANPRNSASGSLRQLDSSITKSRKLLFQVWGVGENTLEYSKLSDMMDFIYSLRFNKPPLREVLRSLEEIEQSYQKLAKMRAELDVMLDGMVIKVDDISSQEALGYTQKYPKWMVAYKFLAVEKETKILDITWQVGRSGVLTPVAELEPVSIDGATISRATLNNFDYIKKLDIRLGDIVTIIRSGDVIPKIIRVLPEYRDGRERAITRPQQCPVCTGELLIEEVLIKCQNLSCPARVVNSIAYFASKPCMNIDGLGERVARELYESGLVKDIEDLYSLRLERVLELEGFGKKRASNLLKAIENSKERECWRFINALGIEHIGEVASKKISQEFGLNFLEAKEAELLAIDGFGVEIVNSYLEFMRLNSQKVKRLLKILSLKLPTKASTIQTIFQGKSVVLTGSMSIPRAEMKEKLESLGAKIVSSVSKKTDFLIYGESSGSKYTKAKELGIKLLSEKELWEEIEKRG